ncbi:MAG: hypothetical protein KF744_09120 [Taibaiella sp.]|nr:hypothetical protein [Taibaiella sp.]
MSETKREPGYYWVKTIEGYERALEFKDGEWRLFDEYRVLLVGDYYFSEINETRILRPGEEQYHVLDAVRDSIDKRESFSYDGDKNELTIKRKGEARIVAIEVKAGFDAPTWDGADRYASEGE